MALITCSECGQPVSDRAAFCPKCGNPINEVKHTPQQPSVTPSTPSVNRQAPRNHVEKSQKSNSTVIISIIVAALFIIGVGVGACFLLSNEGTTEDTELVSENESDIETSAADSVAVYIPSEEEVENDTYNRITSAANKDWSMIKPVRLLSDSAYYEFRANHPSWSEVNNMTGNLGDDLISIKYVFRGNHGNRKMVGRYHNYRLDMDLDFNAQEVDGVIYVQLGHDSYKSHSIMYDDGNGSFEGTWGQKEKHIMLTPQRP